MVNVSLLNENSMAQGQAVSYLPPLLFSENHRSHAAAFFPSPFKRAAVLCLDGVDEWATSSVWVGEGRDLTAQWELSLIHI